MRDEIKRILGTNCQENALPFTRESLRYIPEIKSNGIYGAKFSIYSTDIQEILLEID